jgi:flagellin
VQSANGTNTAADRTSLDQEYQQLASEITRTISATTFNGLAILAADAGALDFQVGANSGQTVSITTTDLSGNADVTAVTGGNVTNAANAGTAITNLDTMLNTLNSERATYGAAQNRFEAVIGVLQVASENQSAARGRIMDADFAAETANLSRAQILQQAGNAMIAQANQLPQQVLKLLQG